MRVILLDWLVGISEEHHLASGTYALAVHLIDYALTLMPIKRSQFQLLGCACIWLAAKLEEVRPPMVENLLFVSDYCFDAETLIAMEQRLIKLLGFRPLIPTRHYFAGRFGRAAACSDKEQSLASYLSELSLYDAGLSKHAMSKVSAAALHLCLQMMRPRVGGQVEGLWSAGLVHYTSYREADLVDIVLQLRALHFRFEDGENHKNMIKKYEKPFYHRAAHVYALRLEDVCFSTAAAKAQFERWKAQEKRRSKEREERERSERLDREAAERDKDRRAQAAQRESHAAAWHGGEGHAAPPPPRMTSTASLSSLASVANLSTLAAIRQGQAKEGQGSSTASSAAEAANALPGPIAGPVLEAAASRGATSSSSSSSSSSAASGSLYRLATGRAAGAALAGSSGSRGATQLSAATAGCVQRRTSYTSTMAGLQSLHTGQPSGHGHGHGHVQSAGTGGGGGHSNPSSGAAPGGIAFAAAGPLGTRQLSYAKRTKTLP